MFNVKSEVKGNLLVLTIDTSVAARVSKAETEKAAKAGREPQATQVATTGGFAICGPLKVSLSAMKA